jgi:hypothetical protein
MALGGTDVSEESITSIIGVKKNQPARKRIWR